MKNEINFEALQEYLKANPKVTKSLLELHASIMGWSEQELQELLKRLEIAEATA